MASPMHPIRPSQILGLSLVGLSISTRDSVLCFSPKKDFSTTRASSSSSSSSPPSPPPPPSPSPSPSPSQSEINGVRQQQHSSGRRWKNRRKTQTFLPSPVRNVSPEDEHALMEQLGYVPPNVCCVSARSGDIPSAPRGGGGRRSVVTNGTRNGDPAMTDTSIGGTGRPIAIMSYPLLVQLDGTGANGSDDARDGAIYRGEGELLRRRGGGGGDSNNKTPFPTLYWLSCPHVSRAISELERGGYVRIFQQRLEDDEELGARWWGCHEDYAAERWGVLSAHDREWLLEERMILGGGGDEREDQKRKSMRDMIRTSGVAGTDHRWAGPGGASVPSVKCLHSHYAHYRSQLSSSNAGHDGDGRVVLNMVGEWTHELLLECFPEILL